MAESCVTSSVRGLSLQIIEEGQCLQPDAYVALPEAANLSMSANVFGYLEAPTRDALAEALANHPDETLSVTSMLRTVAQQYLLYRRYQQARCSIGLAAKPGSTLDLVPSLVGSFDWALNEECLAFDECAAMGPFIAAGKAVFHVEYVDDAWEGQDKLGEVCGGPGTSGFSSFVKTWDLDAFRLACGE